MGQESLLGRQNASSLLQASLSKGDVFLKKFERIEHKKFFVIAGLSQDKVYACSVYINSNIPDFIFKKQELLSLQVPIKGAKYDFLKHDSFVSCNTQIKFDFSEFYNWFESKNCTCVGRLDEEDLSNIQTTLIDSGLLTQNELDLYF